MKIKSIAALSAFCFALSSVNPPLSVLRADDNTENNDVQKSEYVYDMEINELQISDYVYNHFIKSSEKVEIDDELFEKYLKYSFMIKDSSQVSDEILELCRFVVETERSEFPDVYCCSARKKILSGEPQKRASLDEPETIAEIEKSFREYTNDEFLRRIDYPVIPPDIYFKDFGGGDRAEYWMNDEGSERIIFLCGYEGEFEHIIIYDEKPENMENVIPSEDGKSFIYYELIRTREYHEQTEESTYETKYSDIWEYKVLNDGTAVLTGCSLPKWNDAVPIDEVMVLPETIDGIPVSGLCRAINATGITRLVIPENYIHIEGVALLPYLESIEVNAPDTYFDLGICRNCPELKYAKINVKSVVGNSFRHCDKLETVDIVKTETIGVCAFSELQSLSKVTLPEGLQSIGQNAFTDTALTELIIPEDVEIVGAFVTPTYAYDPYTSNDIRIADEDCTIISAYSSEGHYFAVNNKAKYSPADDLIYGDSNNDGVINSLDLISLKQHLLGTCSSGYESDVNKDGVINILDFISLKRNILN